MYLSHITKLLPVLLIDRSAFNNQWIVTNWLLKLTSKKSINRKGRKENTQRSQRILCGLWLCVLCAFFVYFAVKKNLSLVKFQNYEQSFMETWNNDLSVTRSNGQLRINTRRI